MEIRDTKPNYKLQQQFQMDNSPNNLRTQELKNSITQELKNSSTQELKHSRTYVLESFIRRAIDIIVSVLGLLLLSPLFAYVAYRLKKDSPGPLFYRGARAGRGGGTFGILKFRTMYEDERSYNGARITANGDARITPFGKILRDTKLNELPQLWNVLKGEMSLVGPRPEDPEIAATWPADLRQLILSVRPGITSPASVLYRGEEQLLTSSDPMQQYFQSVLPSKLRLDQLYVRNRNLLTDIDVIFWTAIALLPKLRQQPIHETKLFWGPISAFNQRFLNWFIIDTLVAFAAAILSELIWRTSLPLNLGFWMAVLSAFLFGILFSLINALFGLNRVTWSRAAAGDALILGFSVVLATALLIGLKYYFLAPTILPVGTIITTGVLAAIGFVGVRYRERLITGVATRWIHARKDARTIAERALIIGAGDNGEMALWMLHRPSLARAFDVVGILDDDPSKQGSRVSGVEVIGTTQMLRDVVVQRDIGLIVYTIHNVHPIRRMRLIQEAQHTGVRTVVLPDLIAQLAQTQLPSIFAGHPLDRPLTPHEITAALQQLASLAQQGDLNGVQLLANHLVTLMPGAEEEVNGE